MLKFEIVASLKRPFDSIFRKTAINLAKPFLLIIEIDFERREWNFREKIIHILATHILLRVKIWINYVKLKKYAWVRRNDEVRMRCWFSTVTEPRSATQKPLSWRHAAMSGSFEPAANHLYPNAALASSLDCCSINLKYFEFNFPFST